MIHDDIVIGTITVEEHMKVLKEVLDILAANNLTLNHNIVGAEEILGHDIWERLYFSRSRES